LLVFMGNSVGKLDFRGYPHEKTAFVMLSFKYITLTARNTITQISNNNP